MSALNNSALIGASGSTGYQISRSVRLRQSASGYFARTPSSNGSRTTWTWSGWVKRGALGNGALFTAGLISGTFYYTTIGFGDQLVFTNYNDTNAGWLTTTQVFRDPSAWYHIVAVFDSTNATDTERMRLYVNGSRITAFSAGTFPTTYPPLNATSQMNTTAYTAWLGSYVRNGGSGVMFDGYLTEVNFIDGQALTPSSFGETNTVTGVWQPKKYTGTYGTNGFYLNFSDNSAATAAAIGKDYSGNGNNWTPNNISVTAGVTYDSMLDVPTQWADGGNGRGNYATLNPIGSSSSSVINISDGNLKATTSVASISSFFKAGASIAVSTGKWYFESTVGAINVNNWAISIAATPPLQDSSNQNGTLTGEVAYFGKAASFETIYVSNTATYTGTSAAVVNDVIGVAFDADARTIQFYRNNSAISTAQTIPLASTYYISFIVRNNTTAAIHNINFGQQPFAYTPPSGFKALNTLNLPTPTILKGNQYFDATLWTGNGTTQSITNSGGMQPDFLWVKSRSAATANWLVNAVTGAGNGLISNSTAAEQSLGIVTSLDSSGFSVSTIGGTNSTTNGNAATFVGWQWKEGATQGFDIVTYTGTGSATTVAHSLGVAPAMIIAKGRGGTSTSWWVYHKSLGTPVLEMNSTAASATYVSVFNNTAPTSSVFSVGTGDTNRSGQTQLAYLFAEVAGFSKFGSYTGNGSADGPFVFLGFRPALIIVKSATDVDSWRMYDKSRIGYNSSNYVLYPNLSNAEGASTDHFDLLSNGAKIRSNNNNTNGQTYIYAAFAESPFKNSLAR